MAFRSIANPNKGFAGSFGYGDWGYDEVDIMDDGTFIHRVLFSSGIEFEILFSGFKLS